MNADIFLEWQRLQGKNVFQTASSRWIEVGARIYQAFPYHELIEPTAEELRQLFHQHGALGVRYSTNPESPQGIASYHVVFKQTEYPINSLHKKARHDVQRGLKSALIKPISCTRLAEEGWSLHRETLQRQGRPRAESEAWWKLLCLSAEGVPGFEAWAAIVEGRLATTLLAFTSDNCCSILYQQSRTEYLHLGVNNALVFVFTNEVLKRTGPPWLFYGLHSLDAPPSVDEFKFRMGYKAKPVRQRIVFHPALAPLFNTVSYTLLKGLLRLNPNHPTLTKAEGLLRFYLQGKKPFTASAK